MLKPLNVKHTINVLNPTEIIGYKSGVRPGDFILCWCRNSDLGESETEDNFAQIVHFAVLEITYYNNVLDEELAGSENMFSAKVGKLNEVSLKTYLSILPETLELEKPLKVKDKLWINTSVKTVKEELDE
tara:strand:- start:258 stop:647 length:390 start_codon:yes stop_codon:yes gene_type:complete